MRSLTTVATNVFSLVTTLLTPAPGTTPLHALPPIPFPFLPCLFFLSRLSRLSRNLNRCCPTLLPPLPTLLLLRLRVTENQLVGQQLKKLKEKKTGIVAAKPKKQLDEHQKKEFMVLQEQTGAYTRDLRAVVQRINSLSREAAAADNTQNQIKEFSDETSLYRGIGKAYVLQDKKEIDECLTKELDLIDKNYADLKDRKEYLERRITSNKSNINDLIAGAM